MLAATKKSPTNVEFFYTLKKVEKKTHLSMSLFNTLCRGLLVGIKKEPAFQLVPLYLGWVEKKRAQLALSSFYTLYCGWLVGIKKEPN